MLSIGFIMKYFQQLFFLLFVHISEESAIYGFFKQFSIPNYILSYFQFKIPPLSCSQALQTFSICQQISNILKPRIMQTYNQNQFLFSQFFLFFNDLVFHNCLAQGITPYQLGRFNFYIILLCLCYPCSSDITPYILLCQHTFNCYIQDISNIMQMQYVKLKMFKCLDYYKSMFLNL